MPYIFGNSFLMHFDWTYVAFIMPALLITIICQIRVKSSFSKYSNIRNSRRITGAMAAEQLLRAKGVTGVVIEHVAGNLTDHFDPRTNTIRLSDAVYGNTSIAAVGVACHEAGHAVQHAEGYFPNKLRSAILPVANIGSRFSWIVIIVGLLLPVQYNFVCIIGIIMFSASVVFTLVTLPVEFNASKRALSTIQEIRLLNDEEYKGAKSVLTAAAMTYVAAAASSILQLFRLFTIVRRRN